MVQVLVDKNKCEGKANCLEVCPEKVFELKEPNPNDLSWIMRLKLRFHGGKQAFAVNSEKCTACMMCAEECPEKAISVV